jgi:hypothetical protein
LSFSSVIVVVVIIAIDTEIEIQCQRIVIKGHQQGSKHPKEAHHGTCRIISHAPGSPSLWHQQRVEKQKYGIQDNCRTQHEKETLIRRSQFGCGNANDDKGSHQREKAASHL